MNEAFDAFELSAFVRNCYYRWNTQGKREGHRVKPLFCSTMALEHPAMTLYVIDLFLER